MGQTPRLVREAELGDAGQTAGMVRQTAFADPGVWVGTATTEPGAVSGWHHHDRHTTYVFCARGRLRIESGPGGRDAIEGGPGDFILIPAETVHRESNPGEDEQRVVVVRVGEGEVTVNVDGPDPG